MKRATLLLAVAGVFGMLGSPAMAAVLYDNLTPNNSMAMASRTTSGGSFEIESADDFVLTAPSTINSASFIGLINSNTGAPLTISGLTVEIYRVFPLDSNTARNPNVPTRVNSPSDVAFDLRSSTAGLTFNTTVLAATFTALNSVQPGGILPSPGQMTGGNGPITGQEVQFDLTFSTPINLPPGHYFFVPQVDVSSFDFYWLSASRPISGAGTTPFPAGFTDLQAWTRDASLDPDWLRVGADIVGSGTFNAAFELVGTAATAPEPGTLALLGLGLAGLAASRRRRQQSASV